MLPFLGGLIGAGTSLLGGLMGQQNQAAINQQNIMAQEQINSQNIQNQDMLNAQNIAEQEKFAQSGVQWRVADAKAAGISPLAALGAQTSSFANNVGATATAPQAQASNSFGTGVANAGQDISRAMGAMQSPEDRAVAMTKTAQDLENGQLQNDLLKEQIRSSAVRRSAMGAPGTGPGLRHDGGKEMQQVTSASGDVGMFPGRAVEGAAWIDPVAKEQYFVRNQLLPWFGFNLPKEEVARGNTDRNPFTGNYYNRKDAQRWMYNNIPPLYSGVGTSAVSP